MGKKRHLGLSKVKKEKKHKADDSFKESGENKQDTQEQEEQKELTIELKDIADPDDEIAQLRALWRTFIEEDKNNELVLNGVIHECDRLLRKSQGVDAKGTPGEQVEVLPAEFHSLYAMALAEIAYFHAEEISEVAGFLSAALERIELGLEVHRESADLFFKKARILIGQIPLQYIPRLTTESTVSEEFPRLHENLDKALEVYELAERLAQFLNSFDSFDQSNYEILDILDDLLQIVDDFGREKVEGDVSDNEELDDEDVELSKNHPLYQLKRTNEYREWLRKHTEIFLEGLDKQIGRLDPKNKKDKEAQRSLVSLRRRICKKLGHALLQEAELPSHVFTTLAYDDDYADADELEGLSQKDAQRHGKKLIKQALKHLKDAEDEEEPESWVNVAEAMISLANLYDMDSEQQEEYYSKAEEVLKRANNATDNKYQDILDNLKN